MSYFESAEYAQGWIYTGSSVSGDGYGYAILRSDYGHNARFAVRLRLQGMALLAHVASFNEADDLGMSFCHACRQWLNVQAREKAMAQGWAVLG